MKKESERIGIAVATQEAAVSVGEHSNLRDCENSILTIKYGLFK